MNKKYFNTVVEILNKRYSKEAINEVQKFASDYSGNLKDRNKFEEWLADYCLDSIQDLFEQYEVDWE
jgi:hypothetical protein